MIHAYPEIYLHRAQSALGEAFDYAVNICGINGSDFVSMFLVSSVSKRMQNGEPAIIAGKSGVEIAMDIMLEMSGTRIFAEPVYSVGRSAEYWIGWAIAYYQWHSCRNYSEIFRMVSFSELEFLYPTLHEADISKFTDVLDSYFLRNAPETNLKRVRGNSRCSQSELAIRSGVSLRSIQMYEQRNKDINKASAGTLFRLARTLGCTVEDLLEKQTL